MTSIFLAGFCLGMAALWIFLELISMRRRVPPVTMHHRRKYRDEPERHLYSELCEGIDALREMRERGIDYRWLGVTGSEEE